MLVGMIGLDTSHVPAFVRLMNTESSPVRVAAALPAGNPEFPLSRDRIAGFTNEIRQLGVRIVDSMEQLLGCVDGVMVQSVDGRQHLQQARTVFAAGLPIFIDKPLAASLPDVLAIAELGRVHQVPWFTASAMRYTSGFPELRQDSAIGRIQGCDIYGPCRVMPGHPDLFWYGVHGVDLLYSLLGSGCRTVAAIQTQSTEHVIGIWVDGRVGAFRGIRDGPDSAQWGATVTGSSGVRHVSRTYDYGPLVRLIQHFFLTRRSPVPIDEMIEVFRFLDAAEISKQRGGAVVSICEAAAEESAD